MTKDEAIDIVLGLIDEAESITPKEFEDDLPMMADVPDVPEWHDYEHKIWRIGEQIRHVLIDHKSLRKDKLITDRILKFCLNKNSKRGRESFIMLLGYKHNQHLAGELIGLINDKYVYGHVIGTINKIKIEGFEKEIGQHLNDNRTWIRKASEKYINKRYTTNK